MYAIITLKNGKKAKVEKLTEIHYGFYPKMIAFESDLLQRGFTKSMTDIREIEIFSDGK